MAEPTGKRSPTLLKRDVKKFNKGTSDVAIRFVWLTEVTATLWHHSIATHLRFQICLSIHHICVCHHTHYSVQHLEGPGGRAHRQGD